MADYRENQEPETLAELYRRIANLEAQIAGIQGIGNVYTPRINPTDYPTPVEGQHAIDPADEQHMWFSRDQWRKAGAAPRPSIHVYKNTILSVGSDNDKQIKWDLVSSFSTTYFDTTVVTGKVTRIHLKVAGWWAIFGNLTWNVGWDGNQTMYVISVGSAEGSFGMSSPRENGAHVNVYPILAYTRHYPVAAITGLGEVVPTVLEFWVNQDSGISRDLSTAFVEIAYLGAADFI